MKLQIGNVGFPRADARTARRTLPIGRTEVIISTINQYSVYHVMFVRSFLIRLSRLFSVYRCDCDFVVGVRVLLSPFHTARTHGENKIGRRVIKSPLLAARCVARAREKRSGPGVSFYGRGHARGGNLPRDDLSFGGRDDGDTRRNESPREITRSSGPRGYPRAFHAPRETAGRA